MLKRLTALFFILALAGQVMAGVCMCLDEKGSGKAKMSCCLKKKSVRNSISKKSCCDSLCGQTGDNLPRSHSESVVKIPVIVRKAVEKLIISLDARSRAALFAPTLKLTENVSPPLFKPPILYLVNHAFLI